MKKNKNSKTCNKMNKKMNSKSNEKQMNCNSHSSESEDCR